ncbi:hypothetical protein OAA18_00640 [bacterium]|nr:hypothetical protein [bacterium]
MRDYFKNIQTLLVVVLAALLFLQRGCSSTPPVEPEVITEVVTKWDTVKIEKTEYVPKIVEKVVVNIDTFSAPIDTVTVLKDYYAKYFYTDTIQIDTLGSIVINDTITRNLISMRDVQSNIFIPTTTITNTIYLYKREFFGGFSVGATNQAVQNINGELLYINKKRDAYGFGVGLNPQWQPVYTVRMYWKIGK